MFYNKKIDILTGGTGELNDMGIFVSGGEQTVLKTISCDVQSYSKERLFRDHGFSDDVTARVFCDPDDDLKTGTLIKYDNELYEIKRIIKWDDYWILAIGSAGK